MTSHIVIIDDEPITRKQLRRILEKTGYSVSTFSSPQRALKHMEEAFCHLVISDVRMPTMNGLELMSRVKARFPETEVILITGYASLDGAVEATKEGAFYYLEKPFTPDQVRERVRQALKISRARSVKGEIFESDAQKASVSVIIGESPKIREVVSIVRRLGPLIAT